MLLVSAALTVAASDASEWRHVELIALLVVLAVGSDLLTMEVRGMRISGAFLAVVLGMVLAGPAPAVAIAVTSSVIDAMVSRRSWDRAANNIVTWATFAVVGGLLFEVIVDESAPAGSGLWFSVAVLIVFMSTNFLNFLMVVGFHAAKFGADMGHAIRTAFVPVLPSEFATALLTAALAYGYHRMGASVLVLATVVLFVFQYLVRANVQAFERGEELSKRTRELASLQVGVLTAILQTLSMRDAMTARHSAAVARYAREIAARLGLPEHEQDLIHTAALLHDIGKFIFPDSILFADRKLDRRGVGDRQAPPGAGRQARGPDRGLRPGRGDHPQPPRADRRPRLPERARG